MDNNTEQKSHHTVCNTKSFYEPDKQIQMYQYALLIRSLHHRWN